MAKRSSCAGTGGTGVRTAYIGSTAMPRQAAASSTGADHAPILATDTRAHRRPLQRLAPLAVSLVPAASASVPVCFLWQHHQDVAGVGHVVVACAVGAPVAAMDLKNDMGFVRTPRAFSRRWNRHSSRSWRRRRSSLSLSLRPPGAHTEGHGAWAILRQLKCFQTFGIDSNVRRWRLPPPGPGAGR